METTAKDEFLVEAEGKQIRVTYWSEELQDGDWFMLEPDEAKTLAGWLLQEASKAEKAWTPNRTTAST